ncbi:hypothetical protein HYC85_027602 [Camellia sinensis]|uniref:Uncharacterized protein n=1 Tax=Camellia sinensis TaxID=4442 RepID=A0A7J7G6T2_CAMSI|nr:hypothetical protein HYC85_027602 [Camellia sinensis]
MKSSSMVSLSHLHRFIVDENPLFILFLLTSIQIQISQGFWCRYEISQGFQRRHRDHFHHQTIYSS